MDINASFHITATNSTTENDTIFAFDSDGPQCMSSTLKYIFGAIGALAKLFAALLNRSIIITFFKVRRLITPFTIHVVNLILIDLGSVLTLGPMLIAREYDSTFLHYAPLCALYQYFTWLVTALIILQHTVICVDRWLAVYAPIHYRAKKIGHGIAATLFVVIYFHAWFLPMFIQDVSWDAAEGADSGRWLRYLCDAPRPRPYLFVAVTIIFWIPECFVYFSYPLILRLIWKRRKKPVGRKVGPSRQSRRSTLGTTASKQGTADGTAAEAASQFGHAANPTQVDRRELRRRRKEGESTHTLVMVMLAIQMSLWIPITLLLTIKGIRPEPACTTELYGFAYVLGVIILLADPFVYLAFLPDLKREVLKLFPILDFDRWICRRTTCDVAPYPQ